MNLLADADTSTDTDIPIPIEDILASVYPYLQTVYNQTIENWSMEGNMDSTVSLKTDLPSIKIVLKGPIHIEFVLFIRLQFGSVVQF